MSEINLIIFGNKTFSKARERLKNEALYSGFFHRIFTLSEENLPSNIKDFCERNSHIDRGYGLYLWKPVIINQIIKKYGNNEANQIFIYLDSGTFINRFGIHFFHFYLKSLTEKNLFLFLRD